MAFAGALNDAPDILTQTRSYPNGVHELKQARYVQRCAACGVADQQWRGFPDLVHEPTAKTQSVLSKDDRKNPAVTPACPPWLIQVLMVPRERLPHSDWQEPRGE
ncbi:unnamed protein product [Symbiodinium pilosum]|uniref:Uncharacterized protein n=1 Tax=Symbiodinium pilosum TaxID=2952 RepID=A0A812XNP1_SYMPI|nr:unnamed protein product [Symbiodinium pilosum]